MVRNCSKDDPIVQQLILLSAQNANILPITSVCNVKCLFCSHKQNPPEVKTYNIGHRSVKEIEETLDFLSFPTRIVIGESITKINEGEPFSHPQIDEILLTIRRRFPTATIQITSNGSYFTPEKVKFLKQMGNIEINYSLNSGSAEIRKNLMKDSFAETGIKGLKYLKDNSIPFHGSLVAMPHFTGWVDLKETIRYFDQCGAKTIRVFIPGFTRLASQELKLEQQLQKELQEFISEVKASIETPLTLEPQQLIDLKAVVEGVIINSPAQRSGLRQGDIVLKVEGKEVFSRVDAFKKILQLQNPQILVQREKSELTLIINKGAQESSGLVMAYDIDREVVKEIIQQIHRKKANKALVLTSQLAYPVMQLALNQYKKDLSGEVVLLAAENHYFGGSIRAAGLLVVEDFIRTLESSTLENSDLVILPSIAFDSRGYDLVGKSYLEIWERFNKEIIVL